MDQNEMVEHYKKLNIELQFFPKYTNPNDFAKKFEKCTIVKDSDVYYSSSSNSTTERKIIF
ncbi:MAG TPA: hypothetical protein C5S51_08820 [Methanosarcinaceae archaeon]|nr:hypothetical protein [Methanosarcinaceae archaeon]